MANDKGYDVALTIGGGETGDGSSPAPAAPTTTVAPQTFHYEYEFPDGKVVTHDSPTQLTRKEWDQLLQDNIARTVQNSQSTGWQEIMKGVRNTVTPFVAETGGMVAGGMAGAGMGAMVGAMGGPLAPVTVPIGTLLGGAIGGGLGYVAGRNAGRVGQAGLDAVNQAQGGGVYGPGYTPSSPMRTMDMGEFGQTFKEGVEAETLGRVGGPLVAGLAKSRLGLRPQEFLPAVGRGLNVPGIGTRPTEIARENAANVRGIAANLPRANVETGELLSGPGRASTGVDLTAGQQTGRPFFQWSESYAAKSPMGRDKMMGFAERQTEQLQQAGSALQMQATGLPPMDTLTRNNRFVTVMSGQLAKTKAEGNRLFDVAFKEIGPKTPVNATNLTEVAKVIRAEQPTIRGQQVKGFGLGPVDDVLKQVVGRDTEAEIRALLKLPADAPIPPGIQVSNAAPQKPISIDELRILKNRLIDVAYPDRFAGAAVVDSAQVRTARRLIGAIGDDIEAVARSKGPAALHALENAKQFWGTQVSAMDGGWYAEVLADKRVLSDLNTRLFNRNDPGVLLDAKKVTSEEGWKLIQQQYMDMLFKESTILRPEAGGSMGFNGKKFAERVLNPREKIILDALYDPETVKNIRDFAKVASVASPTSAMMSSQVAGLWLGTGQVVGAATGMWQAGQQAIAGNLGSAAATAGATAALYAAPLGMAKLFTNPTATYHLVRAMERGTLSPEAYALIIRTMTEGTSVAVHLPDNYKPSSNRMKLDVQPSDLTTQKPGMSGINQTPDSLVTRY
jgi:hypothetical protein